MKTDKPGIGGKKFKLKLTTFEKSFLELAKKHQNLYNILQFQIEAAVEREIKLNNARKIINED